MDDDSLWAALPVPALLIGADDRIVRVNAAGELFFNASQKALTGVRAGEKLGLDAGLDGTLARVRADRAAVFVHKAGLRRDRLDPVECNIQFAPAGGAGDILVLIEPRDIAGRLDAPHAAKSAARAAIGMAEMLAHEIKNPLAGITGAAQLLAMNLAEQDRELTGLIVAESRRIVTLLDQVEQFGNLRPPARRVVNLHDILDRAVKSAELGFAAKMRLAKDYDPSLPPTWVDPDQVIQVFLNLLKNAAEAAGAGGGRITIRTFYDHALRLRRPDGSGTGLPLQVEILDDGPGIAPEIAASVFEPFVSGRENGTGLGLALVSKIVSDHDGWVSVESRPGATAFRVSLPVAPTGGAPEQKE
ncbi:MAG: PAS domain-containing sensor histidine kinase [Rhodobacterales bacterium]|nr:MAG: PAS domain-containing sensor histidine kinase [Rhodobacterales bacterium]